MSDGLCTGVADVGAVGAGTTLELGAALDVMVGEAEGLPDAAELGALEGIPGEDDGDAVAGGSDTDGLGGALEGVLGVDGGDAVDAAVGSGVGVGEGCWARVSIGVARVTTTNATRMRSS